MAHKVCIDGTAYEIDGGKAMVNGAVYEIDHGTTLVNGAEYEVGFAPSEATVTITKTGGVSTAIFVTIDSVKYTTDAVITVPIGTVIICTPSGSVILNGQTVANGTGVTYNYTVTKNVAINMNWQNGTGTITITEIPEGHAAVNITGTGNDTLKKAANVTIDGTVYKAATTVAVPIGTEIYCYASNTYGENNTYYGTISLNGTFVALGDKYEDRREYWYAEYTYIVNGNVTINLSYNSAGGTIKITET